MQKSRRSKIKKIGQTLFSELSCQTEIVCVQMPYLVLGYLFLVILVVAVFFLFLEFALVAISVSILFIYPLRPIFFFGRLQVIVCRVIDLFIRHASLLRPIGEGGKLKLAADMAQVKVRNS